MVKKCLRTFLNISISILRPFHNRSFLSSLSTSEKPSKKNKKPIHFKPQSLSFTLSTHHQNAFQHPDLQLLHGSQRLLLLRCHVKRLPLGLPLCSSAAGVVG
ncbi:hypothetical protein M406DRAFT_85578 [Cryphonectria parasitica EP155]|uniref:Uncharacterized protein n=1 Tax=Cryphonectria parasitica (strain ATCC 38755 / EP155) TaxID=660469 RepID=A0A9P4XRT1_CRYP1|nr:uncharacterized protein M406DRAFT_85578 [Cryphonectria parasitica EP155]KAF3760284.1 hypothetical protein M406DRAFT_85578 [Cryphonectria parasitica EP155]